ncbi:Phosphatidylserine decarboxylase-related protein [hydrothermal vent metagenome]|uniref:Phosphatidylserine decarboxylase-related protein n=1 Tax=hydrothermal vent metagenome TaxID=652676 RepID=A0A1W1BRB3_9ZZZZ
MEKIRSYFLFLGLKKAGYSAILALVFAIFDFELLASLFLLMALFFLYIYKIPKRLVANISNSGVVAPVDGKVVEIKKEDNKEYGYKVVIDSSFFHAPLLYSPFEAKEGSFYLKRGTRLGQTSHLFKRLNETLEVFFTNGDKSIKIEHRLKRTPLNIELFTKKREFKCGESYGFALNAITTLYLPKDFQANINIGQNLYASQTILGYFSN